MHGIKVDRFNSGFDMNTSGISLERMAAMEARHDAIYHEDMSHE